MYYVIEHDVRPDGITNTKEEGRSTFNLALSLFYQRAGVLVSDTNFVSGHLLLVDEELNIKKADHIKTSYVAPEQNTEE